MPYSFANPVDGSVEITFPDGRTRTIPVNTADIVKNPAKGIVTISYIGEGGWTQDLGIDDIEPAAADLTALNNTLRAFFFADPGGGSVVLPQYANSLTVNAMYRGAALPDPDQQIDGPGTTPPVNGEYRVLFIADNPVETGPYFTNSQGDWIRDPNYNTGAELNQLHVHVTSGDVFGDTDWYQSEATPLVGTDPITFIPAAVMVPGQAAGYESEAVIVGDGATSEFTIQHLHNQQAGLWVASWVGSDFTDVDDLGTIRQRPTVDTVSLAFPAAIDANNRVVVRLRSCTIPA